MQNKYRYDYYDEKSNNDLNEYLEQRRLKLILRKLSLGFFCYVLLTQTIGGIAYNLLNNYGFIMIITTLIPLLIVSKVMPSISFSEMLSYKKKRLKFNDIIFFLGTGLLANLVIANLVAYLLKLFKLNPISVNDILSANMSPILILYVVLIGPIVEEFLYRGFSLQSLSKYSKNAAIAFSTLIFALSHGNLEQSLSVLGIAYVLNYIGYNYSFKLAAIVHILNNLNSLIGMQIIENYGEQSQIAQVYSIILIFLMAYAIVSFIRTRRKNFIANVKSTEKEKEYTKMLFSNKFILALLVFYILLMVLNYILPKYM